MRVRVHHRTSYIYEEPTTFGPHMVRLRPSTHARARVLAYNLQVSGEPEAFHWQLDPWGNRVARVVFDGERAARQLDFTVDASFDIQPVNPFDFFVEESFEEAPVAYSERLKAELAPFLAPIELGPQGRALAESLRPSGRIVDSLVEINRSVASTVGYIIRNEPGLQTPSETLDIGTGSCRDSALLLVGLLRHLGLAARFVSGYLVQLTDEGNLPDEAKGVEKDVVDLHAWAEVFLPGAGWVGLDGTSGLFTGEGHIPLAGTADPALAGPIEGTASGPARELDVSMEVVRLGHEARPRRPYTDEQWAGALDLGRRVDRQLAKAGLRLTMGGEPTWTSRLHPREPEWNGDALGESKWQQGLQLADELGRRLADGGVILHRYGKQYPGESLPRWVLHLLWRRDGAPLWRERRWLDLRAEASEGVDDAAVARLRGALGEALGLGAAAPWHPAHEDAWTFIREEANLPYDEDPLAADLDDSEARRRIARVFSTGLGRTVGHVLPLGRTATGWATDRWTFRRGHLFLLPGDAPMGYRLPLDRIGGMAIGTWEQDPSEPRSPFRSSMDQSRDRLDLAEPDGSEARDRSEDLGGAESGGRQRALFGPPSAVGAHTFFAGQPPAFVSDDKSVRTALCVEPREGVAHVFLPPVPTADDFLTLVDAVETAARTAELPVRIEGYPPPSDPRLGACMVTPDPGVLEVNLPVTERFDDYVALMETTHEAAVHSGLTTEKFQLDGRMAGSGGGHHLTLGGPTALESPFLRDPSLLAGFLRFVQNHPSLSYLFTGLFVGPTSQAPRVDEARHDALYDLEIALAQLEAGAPRPPPPWLVDRLLRNVLVDVTGNTHRAEVSIDKLYDPDLPTGRQGIVELRAFEMPPHERMASAQMLLMRGLVARLAHRPYRNPLVRWGAQLHDRFMLPHFLWTDFLDVLRELREGNLSFDPGLYRPFLDFRCPRVGRHEVEDLEIELRTALEPWSVLGEMGNEVGTVRYVDASVERLEVKVRGLLPDRHCVTVNGRELPLRATGEAGEAVAGVRFKAWEPPRALHPTIPIHHPLRFDVVDTWAKRSLGAATYHVWHPGGRGYDEPPLTAFEAAARRAQRFTTEGHAPYPADRKPATPHPEQPYTLDLRRFTYPGYVR